VHCATGYLVRFSPDSFCWCDLLRPVFSLTWSVLFEMGVTVTFSFEERNSDLSGWC